MATCWAMTAIVGLMAVDSWAVNSAVLARVGSEVIMVDDLLRAERNMRRFAAGNAREMLQPFIDRKLLVLEARRRVWISIPRWSQACNRCVPGD